MIVKQPYCGCLVFLNVTEFDCNRWFITFLNVKLKKIIDYSNKILTRRFFLWYYTTISVEYSGVFGAISLDCDEPGRL